MGTFSDTLGRASKPVEHVVTCLVVTCLYAWPSDLVASLFVANPTAKQTREDTSVKGKPPSYKRTNKPKGILVFSVIRDFLPDVETH